MNTKKNIGIDSKIKDLGNDFINGSSVIAMNSLKVFIDAVELYSNNNDFEFQINDIANKIIQTKPSMSALRNIISEALKEVLLSNNIQSQEIYKNVKKKIELAKKITLDIAISRIIESKFDTIITASFSSTVIKLFSELKSKGYEFRVMILESIWKGIDFSKNLQTECNSIGVPSEIVRKENIPTYDFAVIGVDTIVKLQGVINGIPSKYLAENSKKNNYPFYVIGESYKNYNKIILENGFEFIGNKLIDNIFTDNVFNK